MLWTWTYFTLVINLFLMETPWQDIALVSVLVRSLPPTPYFIINSVVIQPQESVVSAMSAPVYSTIKSSSPNSNPAGSHYKPNEIISVSALAQWNNFDVRTALMSFRGRLDSFTQFIVMKIDFKWQNGTFASGTWHFYFKLIFYCK